MKINIENIKDVRVRAGGDHSDCQRWGKEIKDKIKKDGLLPGEHHIQISPAGGSTSWMDIYFYLMLSDIGTYEVRII